MEELTETEYRKLRYQKAADNLTEFAAKKMYTDLLLGTYNQKYEVLLADHLAQHKAAANRPSTLASNSNLQQINLPPHAIDFVLNPGKSIQPTSFDLIKKEINHKKVQLQTAQEESLFQLCLLKKHAFVDKWRKDKSLEHEVVDTRKIVGKVLTIDKGLQLLLLEDFSRHDDYRRYLGLRGQAAPEFLEDDRHNPSSGLLHEFYFRPVQVHRPVV